MAVIILNYTSVFYISASLNNRILQVEWCSSNYVTKRHWKY